MAGLWSRIPVPEQHVAGLLAGALLDRLVRRRLPRPSAVAGGPLLLGGVAVIAAAVAARGPEDLERPPNLVTVGPYAWSRHPMYVGWSMLHLGCALVLRSPGLLLTWPLSAGLIHREVIREERELAGGFGDAFDRYARAVPRYVDPHHRGIIRS
jgi:protein-S-isoprenylcysteine O-methyltransferase Ste14